MSRTEFSGQDVRILQDRCLCFRSPQTEYFVVAAHCHLVADVEMTVYISPITIRLLHIELSEQAAKKIQDAEDALDKVIGIDQGAGKSSTGDPPVQTGNSLGKYGYDVVEDDFAVDQNGSKDSPASVQANANEFFDSAMVAIENTSRPSASMDITGESSGEMERASDGLSTGPLEAATDDLTIQQGVDEENEVPEKKDPSGLIHGQGCNGNEENNVDFCDIGVAKDIATADDGSAWQVNDSGTNNAAKAVLVHGVDASKIDQTASEEDTISEAASKAEVAINSSLGSAPSSHREAPSPATSSPCASLSPLKRSSTPPVNANESELVTPEAPADDLHEAIARAERAEAIARKLNRYLSQCLTA